MKQLISLLSLSLLPIGLSVAQTSPTTPAPATTSRPAVKPPATRPATASTPSAPTGSTTTGTTNRQQELYDQHHGITRKPTPPAPVSTPASQPTGGYGTAADSRAESSPAASDASLPGLRIGVRGGVTYPVYTENTPFSDPALGFVGGLVLNIGAGKLSFQPEVNYVRTSTKEIGFGADGSISSFDYVQVPLLLKISSGTYAGTRFFLNVGPYGSYVASASFDGKKIPIDGNEGRLSYGAAAGIGAALKAGPGHLTIEVRGHYQLGDNAKPNSGTNNVVPVQATLGYLFPLGGR